MSGTTFEVCSRASVDGETATITFWVRPDKQMTASARRRIPHALHRQYDQRIATHQILAGDTIALRTPNQRRNIVSYDEALERGNKLGASKADDAAVMALFCAYSLQPLVGAVSPKLVWEGAQYRGMTSADLAKLAAENPAATEDLMWVAPNPVGE